MGLSSNTLLHFTRDREALYGILQHGFKVKHCCESFRLHGRDVELHVPMVSFCDIPFSQIKDHTGKYGAYGIGLSKDWALSNRLNPVVYLQAKSHLAESYEGLVKILHEHEKAGDVDRIPRRMAKDIARYIKNYEGKLKIGETLIDKYRFSDEREWRYVPPFSEDYEMMYTSRTFASKGKEAANLSVSHLRLNFKLDDIKYIIIKDDDEISNLVSHIDAVHGGRDTKRQVERVMTRILTHDQILGDF